MTATKKTREIVGVNLNGQPTSQRNAFCEAPGDELVPNFFRTVTCRSDHRVSAGGVLRHTGLKKIHT